MTIICEKNIFQLQIAVNDGPLKTKTLELMKETTYYLVEILKGTSDFGTIKSTLIQWEGSAPGQHCVNFAAFRREYKSVTSVIFTLSEFHDEIQSVSSLKCMVESDQETMICRAKD